MAWTDDMISKLKKLWSDGMTTGEIGKKLGVSKNSVVGKVHRLNLDGRPSPIKKKDDKKPAQKPEAPKKAEPKPAPKPEVKKTEEKAPVVKKVEPVRPVAPVKPIVAPAPIKTYAPEPKKEFMIKPLIASEPKKNKSGIVTLTDLDIHSCRWPLGDPKDDNFHFCGKKVRLGHTYCEEHSAVAYVKATKK